MAKKTITDIKEIDKKISELKIEMLKQHQKKRTIRREIARLLTERTIQLKQKQGGNK